MKTKVLICLVIFVMFLHYSCSKNENSFAFPDSEYIVFAWNDLGMHCLNPTYDELVILPPFNTVNVQVIKRGNPPQVITSGISVEYSIINNSSSYDKRQYGGFWDYYSDLFEGPVPSNDIGMTGTALYGTMIAKSDYFTAEGIPVVPVDDDGVWDPYQEIEITVLDASGNIIATTHATIPTSDEINCAKCHDEESGSAFHDILEEHDEENSTSLLSQQPVLCAGCHGSPALGTSGTGISGKYLSQAIHGAHANRDASCSDCHPGAVTQCNRSIRHMESNSDNDCITCHGNLYEIAESIENGRTPWVNEPACSDCHTNVAEVQTGSGLYRNSHGHGDLYCTACHGSPHAMYPSRETKDNYQPNQYMGSNTKSIGSCGICHGNSRGDGIGDDFTEEHGGNPPGRKMACHICHTAVSTNISNWPHAYTWNNSNTN